MQKITREQLIAKASELLANGTVSCVLGWGAGVCIILQMHQRKARFFICLM